jgi:hypothetical protein
MNSAHAVYVRMYVFLMILTINCHYFLKRPVPRIYIPQEQGGRVIPPGIGLAQLNESESYITIDGQSASLSSNKAPIWGLRPDFYY